MTQIKIEVYDRKDKHLMTFDEAVTKETKNEHVMKAISKAAFKGKMDINRMRLTLNDAKGAAMN